MVCLSHPLLKRPVVQGHSPSFCAHNSVLPYVNVSSIAWGFRYAGFEKGKSFFDQFPYRGALPVSDRFCKDIAIGSIHIFPLDGLSPPGHFLIEDSPS